MTERDPQLPFSHPDDRRDDALDDDGRFPVASNEGTGVTTKDEPLPAGDVAADAATSSRDTNRDTADDISSS